MKTFAEFSRDYKSEYKKFQSSPERIKYRAELVKYNRDKGTYGNGDNKDASHKSGKIVGFEAQSKNRGRAEASRLKKQEKFDTKKMFALAKGKIKARKVGKLGRNISSRSKLRAITAIIGVRG